MSDSGTKPPGYRARRDADRTVDAAVEKSQKRSYRQTTIKNKNDTELSDDEAIAGHSPQDRTLKEGVSET